MNPHRYIQAVAARDIAEEIKHSPESLEQCERALRAEAQREKTEQLGFRFVDLDRRFGI